MFQYFGVLEGGQVNPPSYRTNQQKEGSEIDEIPSDSEDFATLVEVFRTLLKWQDEKDQRMREKSDGLNHHQ